ncbi:hypothetical protein LTR95_010159 [Oleoguttula sp. CCFEE 5521]
MKKVDELLGGALPPSTVLQGMMQYEARREEDCQKLFDNVFVRLSGQEMQQQKDMVQMKHALEACATRHSDVPTASVRGMQELVRGLKEHAAKITEQSDGTLDCEVVKTAAAWVMKLLGEEARGTEEQVALTAVLNASYVQQNMKDVIGRLGAPEDRVCKLEAQVADMLVQQSSSLEQSNKAGQLLEVKCGNGEKMGLMVPKGQGFTPANQKRATSMKTVTMGSQGKAQPSETVVWTQMPPVDAPAPSHGAESAGHSQDNGTAKPTANPTTHHNSSISANNAGSSHITNGTADSKPANAKTAESVNASLALTNGKSNEIPTSKAAISEQAQRTSATLTASGITPAAASWGTLAPDLTKPLPPPPAAIRTGAAKVTLQTPGSSIASPLEIDDDAGKAPAKPKRVPASTSSRALNGSPTLTVPAATFKVSSRAAKSIALRGVPASPVSPPSPPSNTSNHSASSSSMSGMVTAPSSSASPDDAWGSSGGAKASDAKGRQTAATATASAPSATPLSSSWLDSEPDWAQSKAKTTVTVSSEYNPFRGTGGLTGRVPASALAQLDAASGPANKPSSPPRVMSLADAGIAAPNGDKKRAVEPFSMISGPTSKPSFGFQQSTVVLPTSSAVSAAGPQPESRMQESESTRGSSGSENKVSLRRSAVTIKSTPAVDVADQKMPMGAPQITKVTPTSTSPFSTSTTNGSLHPGLTDVTNRTRLDPSASVYTTSSSPSSSFKATTPKMTQATPSTSPRTATTGGLSARAPAFSPPGAQRSSSRHAGQLPTEMLGIMDAASRDKFMAKLEQTMRG